jgi:hypothetical protein
LNAEDQTQLIEINQEYIICGYESERGNCKELDATICYFLPAYSSFALIGESTYFPLYKDILKLSCMRDVVLLGDFNACMQNE